MRYAVISDVHSNLEALEAVLDEIEQRRVDRIVCLGDLVGYNADPNACVRIFMERGIPTLLGNHDAAACGLEEPVNFNSIAQAAVIWTRRNLDSPCRDFLRRQPEQRSLSEGVRLVHGSLLDRDQYLFAYPEVLENALQMGREDPPLRVVFFGHTHHQVAFRYQGRSIAVVPGPRFEIEAQARYLVNPGSVGQPRDRDNRASFLVYDEEARVVEYVRTPYDIASCAGKVLAAGLPFELAERLGQGW